MTRASLLVSLVLIAAATLAPAQIMINEFNTGTPDYQELVNCSASPVDLGGWTSSTWYATAAGALTAETPIVFPTGTILAPGSFLVLQESGTLGQPGTLPNSYSVGFNYFWTSTRTHEFALTDPSGAGIDYVYINWFGNPVAPNLPSGTYWTGSFDTTSGSGDEHRRILDIDTDDASDWTKTAGSGTPAALNPGQNGPTCGGGPGAMMLTVSQSAPGVGDLTLGVASVPASAAEGWTLISTDTTQTAALGPFFGIYPDALTWWGIFEPPRVGYPLHFLIFGGGVYPGSPVVLPPGSTTSLTGQSWDFVVIVIDATLTYISQSNVVRHGFM
jgi:hypothetical protein